MKLSVVIPSRNEPWLRQTIESIRASIRGDTEIIAVIDGEEAEPRLPDVWPDGPRVRVIRNRSPLGQRQSCNIGVMASAAEFILKTDAHSLFDVGFDVKLMADCDDDWTVIPSMFNLHSHDMVCPHCGERFYNRPPMAKCEKCLSAIRLERELVWKPNEKKGATDWMWFRSFRAKDEPFRVKYWDAVTSREFPAEYAAWKTWAKAQREIADVMTGQGACWLMKRNRYWQLGGMDEAHGGWGQMGVEVACKSWLSGGRQVVNRKTWFAHLFRCGASEGPCWEMSGKQQDAARKYSINLWSKNLWPGQKKPLLWLVDKFWPIPTWDKPTAEQTVFSNGFTPALPETASNTVETTVRPSDCPTVKLSDRLTVLYYTDDSLPADFAARVLSQIVRAAGEAPIVVQRQPGEWPRCHESIYRNILAGLEKVTTPYVALAEHDVLYPKGYFDHIPQNAFEYNVNRWILHVDLKAFSRRKERALSGLFAKTTDLVAVLKGDLKAVSDAAIRLEPNGTTFKTTLPVIDISGHGYNLTAPKHPKSETRDSVKPWGTAAEVIRSFCVPQPAKLETRTVQSKNPVLSVLIPARNEEYLVATVNDLLKNLRTDFEILVGWDGDDQGEVPGFADDRIRIVRSGARIGMRPMINRLAREAKGEFLMRMDAHCSVDAGIDGKLIEVLKGQNAASAVVAMRYELDPREWKRRDKTDVPYRRLSHKDEDGRGLRSLPWPEYAVGRENIEVDETMSCSGSSWTCRRSTFVDWWGGFDEKHGIFGQEGVEIACMTWLSGGRFLVHKGTWYAHWNRGHAPYSLGATVKTQSIDRSHWLWVENNWKHARYSFEWLLEKFHPPGWERELARINRPVPRAIASIEQQSPCKARKRLLVKDLWDERDIISDPGKRWRIGIFWKAFDEFVRSVLAGKPDWNGQYRQYLISHLSRDPGYQPSAKERAKVEKTMQDGARLTESVKANGLLAPLEFYHGDGRMILWKGYRRLVVARACGIEKVVGRTFIDRDAAGRLSPQAKLTKVFPAGPEDLHRLAEQQFKRWGHCCTDKYYTHGYTRLYDMYLAPIRRRVKKVLEVGLLNGASLALWRDYFPKAHLVGADIEPERWKKFAGDVQNLEILIGDETDAQFMAQVAAAGPYDLIVDDGSHDPAIQAAAFQALWPSVRQYGFYVIEDTFRSWEKDATVPCLPAGFESRIYSTRDVLAIHHHPNIIFVQKG